MTSMLLFSFHDNPVVEAFRELPKAATTFELDMEYLKFQIWDVRRILVHVYLRKLA